LENNLQKQQQEKGENMRRQEGARQRAVGHAAEVVGELVGKYSNVANLSQGTKPQQILSGVMDLTSVSVGFAAEGLHQVLKAVEAGSEKGVFFGAVATYGSGKYFLSKGFGRDNPARKMREAELGLLKGNLETDIKKLKEILSVMNAASKPTEETSSSLEDLVAAHPSSKLLKAMTKFQNDMAGLDQVGGVNLQQLAFTNLAKAIDDEIKRLGKFEHTSTANMGPIKKLITELHNRFKDIMLSFRESKLQGLKHVALGFGELLLGIGAVVATFAAALVLIPLVAVPCFGINLATRITSSLAGVCVFVANRLYHAFAMLNSALFLKRDQQDDFSKSIDGRVKELDDLQTRLFDLALKGYKSDSRSSSSPQTVPPIKGSQMKEEGYSSVNVDPSVVPSTERRLSGAGDSQEPEAVLPPLRTDPVNLGEVKMVVDSVVRDVVAAVTARTDSASILATGLRNQQ